MPVNINTKMVTLLGKPLGQSFASRMQNAAYRAAGLDMLYFYTEVEPDHLGDVIKGIRHMNFAGAAVTKPNKVEVLQYLDELDPLCEKMGACNTIVFKDGKLIGHNTDGVGFFVSLTTETDVDVKNSAFFCIGAGGAGRAICSVLAYHGAKKIYVMDLYPEAASSLVDDINRNFAPVAELVDFADKDAVYAKVAESDVLMNNSGLGMGSHLDETPLPKEVLKPNQLCFDAIYNPAKTRFLKEAEEVGCKILNGLGMTLHQGAAQIKLWSGVDAPVDVMHNELMNILAGKPEQA